LTAQKLAEQSATLNDAGAYVGIGGSGALWSDYFWYENVHSNLVQRLDARGMKTNYWYFNSAGHTDPGDGTLPDPLNRACNRFRGIRALLIRIFRRLIPTMF